MAGEARDVARYMQDCSVYEPKEKIARKRRDGEKRKKERRDGHGGGKKRKAREGETLSSHAAWDGPRNSADKIGGSLGRPIYS